MRKDGIKKGFGIFRGVRLLVITLVLSLCLSLPKPALASCEDPSDTGGILTSLVQSDVEYIDLFIMQEANFIWNILSTAFEDIAIAYQTFAQNIEEAFNAFATEFTAKGMPGMRSATMELHAAVVNQSYQLGLLQDAQLMTEEESREQNLVKDAWKRYAPSELACEIDSTGPGLNRAYQISRALNRTLAIDDAPRHENADSTWPTICVGNIKYVDDKGKNYTCTDGNWALLPTTSFNGKGQDINDAWTEYVLKYCDNTMGDQGCTTPGIDAGRHRDIGALLWGPQLTIDPTNPEEIRVMQANLRYIVDPLAPDLIPQSIVPMPNSPGGLPQAEAGRQVILERHAELAYANTIYNTLGAMLSERVGGSGVDPTFMREAAGIPKQDTAADNVISSAGTPVGASYRELQEAMTRDRFNNPQYIMKMISDPAQVARERNVLSALRLQTMNDIYRRQEELLFMESAEYGRDLNSQIPRAETGNMPLK